MSFLSFVRITHIHITSQVHILVLHVAELEDRELEGIALAVDGGVDGFEGPVIAVTSKTKQLN